MLFDVLLDRRWHEIGDWHTSCKRLRMAVEEIATSGVATIDIRPRAVGIVRKIDSRSTLTPGRVATAIRAISTMPSGASQVGKSLR